MDFTGKVCPYCKSKFKEDDDVVICSVCEMPHHKECWIENKACTTFGCTGTIMGINKYKNALFCSQCGSTYIEGEEICACCGNLLSKAGEEQTQYAYYSEYQQPLDPNQYQYSSPTYGGGYGNANTCYNPHDNKIMKEDILAFIRTNSNYYIKKFEKFELDNSNTSWNWASAFLGGFWYGYRKMYKNQFIYYIIFLCSMLLPLIGRIVVFILSGMFGNYVYKCHVEKHVEMGKTMDDYTKQSYLMKKGGTSAGAVWAIIGLRILIPIIFIAAIDIYR